MQAIVGSQLMDDERLHTLLCEVETVINGRPLTPSSNDPNDLEALTPRHLLRMNSNSFPTEDKPTLGDTYRRRWKHAQYMADQFWKRWTREYLPTLRKRQGTFKSGHNLQRGDMVIIAEPSLPRNKWLLGLVIEAMPSEDGEVRKVRVKTKSSTLVRPVTKLCWLEGVGDEKLGLSFE
ncbi:uncharacterized protein LOC123514382 [Portunus trituberculatus]|uniref:uncharacterized protein LOC123514382 n=1 Tax=Portunus trituberculatus TaxID=210409 RepID=UPI001E1CE935|nr:uncharacterized protein LOC123514382 [Portunus trituberculatus]